ncbi:RHS repeat-associated core domain-containing protein [Pectobacterium carotovorum]|uniref:RHS repeat-associated core domain-containing protein n=1 Tax=Pectobacterium carotovorum TaxID=554 RepID=UPI001F35DFF8|nr:RHS repeat-associated core domain-containing protein [Pectobacterium carotovorum]
MSQNKQATLLSSEDAASRGFSTDKKISGGCVECGCEILIYYHYDSGEPVPNAPFVLIDSNKTEIHGQTDANGLCFIYDMGCSTFELMLEEGEDKFTPQETIQNNPVLQSTPGYAALAGEYFTLFLLLRKQGLVTYDADDSSDRHVDVDGAGILTSIPDDYKKAYKRFWELDKQINRGNRQLKQAINKIHHSLAAETADAGGDDNAALMMFCEIILGCIPVVGQALDVYSIGEWCWQTHEDPKLMDDPLHVAGGVLCVIGVIPGLGDAIKVSGRAIIKALRNASSPAAVQFAIKTIRSLSNGNLVKGVTELRGLLKEYGKKGKAMLLTMQQALVTAMKASEKDGWIVALMKDRFSKMLDYLDQLVKRYDEAIATLEKEFDKFIPLIVTRVSGSPRPKGSFAKKADAPQSHTTAESRAASPSSGSKSEPTDAPTATKQSDAKPGGDKGKDQRPKKQSPEDNVPHKSEPSKPTDAIEEKPKPKAPVEKKSQSAPAEAENINAGKNTEKPSGKKGAQAEAQSNDGKTPADSKNSKEKGDPVDMATGAVVEQRTDIQLTGTLPLSLQRYYRSTGERYAGLLGRLWRTNWDISLTLNNGVATLTDGEFNQAFFVLPNEGEVSRSPSNLQWRLTRQQGELVLHHVDGLRYRFEHALGLQLCLTSIEDTAGNRVTFEWMLSDLCWVVLSDGRLIHVTTERRRITALTLCTPQRQPLKTLASYTYDEHGHLLSIRADEGRNFDYRYSPEGWLLRWSDLGSTWVEHDYDKKGRAIRDRTSEGYWPGHFEYDDNTLTSHYHSGFGGVFSYVRDERNNILLQRTPDGGETRYEWVDNQLVAETDPLGGRTAYQRNDWGQVTEVTLPDGATHQYEYDDNGQLLAYIDPLGSEWHYQRNAAGQVVEVNDPEGREWLYRYGETGQLSTVIGPDGVLQRYHYNRRGLLSSLERDNAPAVMFRYDDLDRLTERHIGHEAGVQVRRWEYDGVRESPSKVVYEDGSETRFGYDVEGNLTAVTDALGQRYQFRYGAFDNLLEATDPLGATVRYHYNAEAEFAGVTNSQGRDWTYGFDPSGRLSEERHYDGRVYRYQYDVADRLVQRTAPDGSALHYEHDAAGRITRITAQKADGETDGITELAYDVAGRLTKAASPDAVVEYAYNRAGQVTSETVNGEAVQSGYDAGGQRAVVEGILAPLQLAWQSGRLSSLGIGSHQPLQFSHTAAGEEQRRTNGCGFALRHEWSPTGLLQRQALEGADGRVNDVLERRYQYDVLDRLTGISDSHWGEQAFRLNGAGQVTAERRDEGRRRQARLFGYDSEQNLCEVSQIAPGLGETLKVQDAVVQASARYDAAGRVVERGHTQYRYDDCGRLAMKRETRPGFRPKETYFDWDVQDRLVRVSLPDGARWRYRYDAFGRRVSKVREGQVPSAQAVARVAYRWDGDQLIGQQQYYADGSAAREVQWVYEPGSFRPLAQVEAQGDSTQLHYIVADLTGTARELCSEEGEVRWRGEQGLWGAHREERRPIPLRRYLGDAANEEVYCELRYQGQLYDAETGLYYNRHRYYDAESGQYLSPDPIGLGGGIRPQGYVHNPLEWVDPLGLAESGCSGDPNSNKSDKTRKPVAGKITGYTKHGLNQAVGRNGGKGVNAKDMLDAVKNPKKVVENANGTTRYQGKRATVVLNQEGKVVTTFGKSRGPEIWSQGTSRVSGSGSAQRRANDLGFSYNPKMVR